MDLQVARVDSIARIPLAPFPKRLTSFTRWGALVGLCFFSVYPTTNWLASLRSHHYAIFLQGELALPFVPEFIWLYLSMYVLFALPPFFLDPPQLKRLARELIAATVVAGVVFVIVPAQLGFPRELPGNELHRALFQRLFSLDRPFNLVPSLHVVYSTTISLAIMRDASPGLRAALGAWLLLIVASTVLVHQHHLVDVVAGLALSAFIHSSTEGKHD